MQISRTCKTAPWNSCKILKRIQKISIPESQGSGYNQHGATTRAIVHAQSAEKVARGIPKFVPHHSESKVRRVIPQVAPQREPSDTHKVMRELHEWSQTSHRATTRAIWHAQSHQRVAQAHVRWSQNIPRSTKMNIEHANIDVLPRSQPLFCPGLQSTAPATNNGPEASEVPHLPSGSIIIVQNQIRHDGSTKHDFRPFQIVVQWPPKVPLILPTPAKVLCSNVQKVPRLPHGWKSVLCPAPVTQNAVLDFNQIQ